WGGGLDKNLLMTFLFQVFFQCLRREILAGVAVVDKLPEGEDAVISGVILQFLDKIMFMCRLHIIDLLVMLLNNIWGGIYFQEPAILDKSDAITEGGLIHIRGRDQGGNAFVIQSFQHVPEFFSRYRLYSR